MPSVSNCPACKEKVTIPDGVADDAALCCPFCQAQFSLSDVVLAATAAPPVVLLVDATPELAASDADPEVADPAEATDEPAGSEGTIEESIIDAEPEDRLTVEVDSLRSKTEAFEGRADPSADDPEDLQVQADELGQEAQALLAKVGQWTNEAKEAEAKAMALVTQAQGYRKTTGNALGALADALEVVARSFDDKCAVLIAELDGESSAVEEEQAEATDAVEEAAPSESVEDAPNPFAFLQGSEHGSEKENVATREEEPKAEEPQESPPVEEQEDPFAFLREDRSSEAQAEAAAEEEELVLEEPQPAVEEAEPSVKETDMFSFLAQIDQAAEEKTDASVSEQDELTLEEPESAVADESEASLEPEDSPETESDELELAETDDKAEQLELASESSVADEADQAGGATDAESLRMRLETLRAVASALKAKAAELREEANALLDESAEYAVQGAAGEGWASAPWQPDGASSAGGVGEVGVGAFSFEGGAAGAGTPGRAVRPGRRKKETSFVKELIGIVLGGAGGLLIAYYGLNFFGGARYDFAKIYLPGIKHTVKHQPAWWPKWAQVEGSDDAQEETGAEPAWEEATIAQPPVAVERKASKPSKKSRSSKTPAKVALELPAEPGFAAPPELPSQPDLMASPDLGFTPDLGPRPDMAAPSELTVSPDLAAPPEMSLAPDLAAPSDLTLSPELMGTPQPKPSKPATTEEESKPAAAKEEDAKPAPLQEEPKAAPVKETQVKPAPAKQEKAKPAPAKQAAEAPASKPSAVPVSYVDLKNRPKYAPEDLTQALKDFPEAFGCPKCNSTGRVDDAVCPDCQGQPSVAYAEFCRLGEVIAFVDTAAGEQLDARRTEARDLIEKAGSKPELVKEIGRLAVSVLDDEKRTSPGIFFPGTVVDVGAKGKLQAATIKLAGVDRTLKVVSKEPMDLAAKDRVLVLGCLVKNGSANQAETAASLFVWRGTVVKFSK